MAIANTSIREYVRHNKKSSDPSSWLNKSEIPSATEISGAGSRDAEEDVLEIPVNKTVGPWESVEEYLCGHYALLREDAVAPLRNVVSEICMEPQILEKDSQENASIYEKVHITGFTFANGGIAARITFSLRRAGKKIAWEQSKRLIAGSVVALTPANDMFQKICRMAVVAARPLLGVQMNPPEIDIFFANADDIEIDPQQEWVMVESRDGYFEGSRYTLRALQKMANETFPLSKYLVHVERDIDPPPYLEDRPVKNLSLLYHSVSAEDSVNEYLEVDIINSWPPNPPPVLDASQHDALERILTKELAIVQGPPGTGKTYVSVVALELLLRNMAPGDPPVILAAHTNHAVDQLLRHVARFEPGFIRLGGRSTDMENIKPRTLFEVKSADRQSNPAAPRMPSTARQKQHIQEMQHLLAPLTESDQPFSSELFKQYGIITEAQQNSLQKGAAEWVRADQADQVPGDIAMWLGRDLVTANRRTMPEEFGFDFEDVDLEFEQIKEMEAESKIDDDNDLLEILKGPRIVFNEPFTGRKTRGVTEEKIKISLEKEDMWEIDEAYRGPIYCYLQRQLKNKIQEVFRKMAKTYADIILGMKIGRWEVDSTYLKKARVIGMTTTGLSKYRALIQSVNPKIVLIEEAAETLEAYVTTACFQSLHHLILVGDHQQLRGHCNDPDLQGHPFFLDVSMFERLVKNHVGYAQMIKQRRMIPEIRRALKPIYETLEDHESVLNRPPIPGMGGVNTFFFSHEWPESSDSLMSKVNHEEAGMIVGFFDYLVHNGMDTKSITVLTFYNGQRKLLLKGLREHPNLQGCIFKVMTVDSYQGEENDVVLLSLVRNNSNQKIGFLDVDNRVCVALSRAQRGFYLFGNCQMLSHASPLWWDVVQAMSEEPNRVGFKLPVTCKNHNKTIPVTEPREFSVLTGGCDEPCRVELPCGHVCALNCHPFAHEMVNCKKPCTKPRECGHNCTEICHLPCRCACTADRGRPTLRRASPGRSSPQSRHRPPPNPASLTSQGQAFRDFASGGHVEADATLVAMAANDMSQLRLQKADKDMASALFGKDNETKKTGPKKTDKVAPVTKAPSSASFSSASSAPNGAAPRTVWKGLYEGEKANGDDGGKKEGQTSLLD